VGDVLRDTGESAMPHPLVLLIEAKTSTLSPHVDPSTIRGPDLIPFERFVKIEGVLGIMQLFFIPQKGTKSCIYVLSD